MIRLNQGSVLSSAQIHHGGGKSAGADDVLIIADRLTVKLHQTAEIALVQLKVNQFVIFSSIRIRDILCGGRHIIENNLRPFRKCFPACNTNLISHTIKTPVCQIFLLWIRRRIPS